MDGNETGYIERYAAMCEIKQIEVDSTQPFLRIVLLKCVRGKDSYPAWHVSQYWVGNSMVVNMFSDFSCLYDFHYASK